MILKERPSTAAALVKKCGLALLVLLACASSALAATVQVQVLLDLDTNPATGCTIVTSVGTFNGAEQVLTTTVDTTSNTVTAVSRQVCTGGVLGAPIAVNAPFVPPWPIGVGAGVGGSTIIETYVPLSAIPMSGISFRAGFVTTDQLGQQDGFLSGALVFPAGEPNIPTLSQWGLILLGTFLAGAALLVLKRSGANAAFVFILVALLVGGVALAAITLTGNPADWNGIPPLATKAPGVNPTRAELYAVYAVGDGSNMFFRFDVKLCPVITVSPNTLPAGSSGSAYPATNFTQVGGALPITWSETGALPTGMSFTAAGVLSGTPTQTGSFPITFTASDANLCSGSQAITLTINACPAITVNPAVLASGTGASPYGPVTFTAVGGTGAITWSNTGALPTGMSFSAGGVLSGTPMQTGSFPITFIATDSVGCTGSRAITLVIACPTITVTNPGVTTGTANAAFSQVFSQSGAIGATTFALASGSLPTGLALAANGTLSGTPTQTGSFPITVTATDANGCTGTGATYTLVIGCETITVNNPATTLGTLGSPFSQTFTQSGAIGATTFTLASGFLPTGLTLATNGTLSGTPTQGGSFPITVTVTDGNGCTGTGATYNLVTTCQTITVTNPATSTGTISSPFSQTFTQTGAIGGATFTTASTLPTGLSLATNGTLSGTPTQTGTFPIVVTVTDGNGCTGTGATYNLVISCQAMSVDPASVPQGTTGLAYPGVTFTQTGGIGAVTFSQTGTLPTGINFTGGASGALSGTPSQSGSFPITVTATDSNGCTGSHDYLLVVVCSGTSITLSPGSLPTVTVNTAFPSTPFSASGGVGPYTFSKAGALPAGMNFVGNTLSGTPTQTGVFPFTISATDTVGGCVGSQDYVVTVTCSGVTITVNPASLLAGAPGTLYPSVTFTASGTGTAPFTFTEVGALPSGMSFSVDTLSGTPTAAGNFPVTVTATDANGCTGATSYTLSIVCQAINVTNPGTTTGTVDAAFSQTFTQTGAVGTATFTTASLLPAGLNLSTTGTLSGTPTVTGTFPITVKVTDSNGCTGTGATYTLVINCQTITVTNPAVTTGTANTAFSQTFTQSAGHGTTTFSTATTLPTGLTLSTASGVLSGTPTQTGTFPITVTATDSNGCQGTGPTYSLVIACQTITVTNPATTAAVFNTPFSQTFTAGNTIGATTFALSSGTLPAGLALATNGLLSGTPTQTGTFPITVTATDANGCTGTGATYTLTVAPVAVTDSYSGLVDNTQFVITGGSTGSPATPFVGATGNILTNDLPSGSITPTAGTFASTGGGSVTIAADGTFIYTPKTNPTLAATTSDSFTYTISSNTGATATPTTANGTVNLTLAGRVWYVKNNGGAGNGQSQSSFNLLSSAIAASTANDNIFVYQGDGTTTNLATASVLKTGQKFIGEGAALVVNGNTLVPAGNFPIIGNTLTLANNVTVNGIDMSTGASNGIAGNGVTGVSVTARSVVAAGGIAVNLVNSDGTFTFRSVSANGGANGIVWNNASAATGLLTVTGDGTTNTCRTGTTACSGGTVQATTGDGISLTKAKVNLALMWIKNNANSGIKGTTVNGFAATDVLLQNNTNATGEQAGILINDLTDPGAVVTRAEVSGSTEDNVRIHNTNTTGTITFTSCTIKDNSVGSGNNGIFFQTNSSGHLTGTVQNSTFTGNRAISLSADSGDNSTVSANFLNNTITAGAPNQGNQGIQVSRAVTSTLTFDVDGNNVNGMISTLINVFSGGGPGTATGDVKNNTCVGTGVGGNQIGIRLFNSGSLATGFGTMNVNVANNNVSAIDNAYPILGEASGSTGAGGLLKIAVTGNTADVVGGGAALDSIRLQARNTSTVCATVSGNTTNSGGPGFFGLQIRQANTAVFNLEGLTLGPQVDPTVHDYLAAQNPGAASVGTLVGVSSGPINGVAVNSCGITP